MSSFQYLDKRINGHSGEILRFSSYRLSYDAAYRCFNLIKNYNTYHKLTNILPKDLVSMYFTKLFYREFLHIAHQIKIREWDNKYDKKNFTRFIDTSYFSCMPILKKLLIDYNIDKDTCIHFFNFKRIINNKLINLYRFIKNYMDWINHSEFGLSYQPITSENLEYSNPDCIDHWLEQWYLLYERLTRSYKGDGNIVFVNGGSLHSGESWNKIGDFLEIGFYDFDFINTKRDIETYCSQELYQKCKILYSDLNKIAI